VSQTEQASHNAFGAEYMKASFAPMTANVAHNQDLVQGRQNAVRQHQERASMPL